MTRPETCTQYNTGPLIPIKPPKYVRQYGDDLVSGPKHTYPHVEYAEMRRDIGGPFFWCSKWNEVGERGDGDCGAECQYYQPRNGKNGICLHWRHSFVETGRMVIRIDDQWYEKKEVTE